MDAEKQGYYDRLAADEKIKDLIESYKGITGDCDMFAGIPENLPPMLLKTAAEIRQEFHQIARDFPEYKSLAAMADTRSPIIRGQGVVEEDEVQVSSTRQPGRIQGMVIEEDDPFAAMRKKKEQEKAANAPRNGMVVEDDDAALFAKKPEKPAEKTDDSEWGTLNRQGVPEGKFSPEEEELPDFDISAPAGIIGDAPISPVSPVPPVPSEPMAESRPESQPELQPEPVAESKPDEPKASDSAENAIVNDESTSAYFRHMEEQREKQKQLLDQEKTQYVNGKLQRESSMEGGAEVNKEDSGPRMMNYRGRIVPEDEYRRLIQQEMEEAGQDEQGEDVVHPAEPPVAQEPEEPVFFRPEPRPEPTPEVSHKEEPVFFRPQPYSEPQPEPHPEPQPEPAASSDVPPDPFESAPEHDPFAPLNESETPKPSTEQPKSEAPFSLFGDKPVDAPAGNEKPSKNQERAEEISRMVHNESDPFAPIKESAKEEQKKSQAEMDIEDALEENTCLRDMTEFSDIFHGNSERKDDEGAKEESGSVFGGFNFKDLFGKIGK